MTRALLSPLSRLRSALPSGNTLPEREFARRHRLLLGLLWAHVPILLVWALGNGLSPGHAVLEAAFPALPAAAATWWCTDGKRSSALVAFGLISCSAVVVHLSGGYIEAHFHFFVMIVALTLYEDYLPFGLAAAYVLVHHGAGAALADANTVYNHPDAVAHPWKWAGIHAGFVSAAGIAGIVGWRLNEDVRRERETALRRALEAEAEAKRTAAELRRSNRDLEQFAYVASHDLSEPLRTVSSFVTLLQKRYAGRLDPDADEFIGYAVDGTRRMQRLIDDLLHLSRSGRGEHAAEPVALDVLAAEVLEGLGNRIAESHATVTVGPLPEVAGDAGQLRQVLQNLLSNAMKFVQDGDPVVTVDAEPADEEGLVCVTVQDNGIGIEPAQADRVFQMFGRLHGRDRYEGTGIGLAIVLRVVEHHGGRVWVEPAPGGGSRFRFTLKAAGSSDPGPPLEDRGSRAVTDRHAGAAAI